MHTTTPLISTLVGAFVAAFVFGMIANRLRVAPIAGFLAAGIVIGPFTPGFVADPHLAPELAEIGVILLMFGVGLHFSLADLLAVQARRGARCDRADPAGDRTRCGARDVPRLGPRCQPGVRTRPVGRQHRRADPRTRAARPARHARRADRGRLADRRGPGDGAGAGAAAGDCRATGRRRRVRRRAAMGRAAAGRRHHDRQGCAVRRPDARDRPPRGAVAARPRRGHGFAGALHAGGARNRARCRLRLRIPVRRLVCAGRVLCRHAAQRVRPESPGGVRLAAAARCLRGAVLRVGRHVVRSKRAAPRAVGRAGGRCS